MKNTLTKIAVGTSSALILLSASSAFALDVGARAGLRAGTASTTVQARLDANVEARLTKGKERAHEEIQRRITGMQELATRIQAMARVSAQVKANIAATLQSQIGVLTALDAKIAADTDLETLKVDIKSITGDYRIFALVMPQGRIMAAADRLKTVAADLTTLAGKLSVRITAAQTAGKDTAALSAMLVDMNAKIADIGVQADAAISAVAGLTPDNGDQTKRAANEKALADARAKLKVGQTDVQAARKDAGSIVNGLKAFHLEANASSTAQLH